MKLARKALDNPDRMLELEESLDGEVAELIAEAEDAGYSAKESIKAMESVLRNQGYALGEHPDPADDPS